MSTTPKNLTCIQRINAPNKSEIENKSNYI